MRIIREVLRLRLEAGLSIRQIKASTKTSVGAIQKLLARADALNLNWSLPEDLDEGRLAALCYPSADPVIPPFLAEFKSRPQATMANFY